MTPFLSEFTGNLVLVGATVRLAFACNDFGSLIDLHGPLWCEKDRKHSRCFFFAPCSPLDYVLGIWNEGHKEDLG